MNKMELVEKIAARTELTKKDSALALDAALESITQAMKEGDKVQIVGFGSFEVKHRAARTGRNPKTKETIEIPASTVPVFKPGKGLKDSVQ